MKKDLNDIAAVEKAISKKYGDETIVNPKSTWDENKEKEYIEQVKQEAKKDISNPKKAPKVELNGFLLSEKLINKQSERTCPVCNTYSFDKKDDLYMNRYECCCKCYINFVEGREKRWASGWRPWYLENEND
jgi:hypothetical protein|tara:strand:- start:114 stop:509 length:396 start_codon:yes stop_codon:yes gene_type:complete